MPSQPYIVYDFETGDKDPTTTEPIEIAAIVLDRATLTEIDHFCYMCRPEDMSLVMDGALKVNKKTREEIEAARPLKDVWHEFIAFCVKHSPNGTKYNFPIMAGHNIINFDNIISNRMNERYKIPFHGGDTRYKQFHPQYCMDTMQIMHTWYEGAELHMRPKTFSMDNICPFLGINNEDAHSALPDVRNTAKILVMFLKMFRNLSAKVKLEGIYL